MGHVSFPPLRIFLCHVSDDKPKVRQLHNKLAADGYDAWLDEEKLLPGQEWQIEIPKAVRNADVIIVCLSERFIVKEGYGQKEIKLALDVADEKPEGTIFIVPAKLEECKVPDRLIRWHWVDLFKQKGYAKLRLALHSRAAQLNSDPVLQKDQNKPDLFAELELAQMKLQWPVVIRLCDLLLKTDSDNVELYTTRAKACVSLGKYQQAIMDASRAIQIDPQNASAFTIRAQAHYHQGDDEKAISDSTNAIALDPRSALAYQVQADSHRMKRSYDQAIADATMSIKIEPNMDAYITRAKSFMQTGMYEQAISDTEQIIAMDSNTAFAYGTRAVACLYLKNFPDAIANAEKAIKLDPTVGGYYFASAEAHYATGNYDKAIKDASRSIELDPEYAPAYRTRAKSHLKLNNEESAAKDFERAKKLAEKAP